MLQQRLFSAERRYKKDGQYFQEKVIANCIQEPQEKEASCTLTIDVFSLPTTQYGTPTLVSRNVEQNVPYSQLKEKLIVHPSFSKISPPSTTENAVSEGKLNSTWIEADPRLFYKVNTKLLDA